uniref:Uncharacterized protein n=1 Tax=Arundo donax TaxID=35708 RepID=A0A0A8ZFR4_ARUDO
MGICIKGNKTLNPWS